jgi:DNA repair exonuclease SbcCD ATPase subunit
VINFKSVVIQNFGSYKEATIELSNRGLILVKGENRDDSSADSNGAGKTTMFDAITWCLFEETIKNVPSDKVVNRIIGCDCMVKVTMEINNSEVIVTRYRKHKTHKDDVLMLVDNVAVNGDTNSGTTDKIIEQLGMDFTLFKTSVLFGQGVVSQFAALTDKGQKEVLESIMGITKFEDYLEVTKKKLKVYKAEEDILNAGLLKLDNNAETSHRIINDLEMRHQEFENARNSRVELLKSSLNLISYDEIDKKINTLSEELNSIEDTKQILNEDTFLLKKQELSSLQRKLGELESSHSYESKELHNINLKLATYEKVDVGITQYNVDKTNTDIKNNIEALEKISNDTKTYESALSELIGTTIRIETNLASARTEKAKLTGLDAICPVCNQEVDEAHLKNELATISLKEEALNTDLLESTELQKSITDTLSTLKTEFSLLQKTSNDLNNQLNTLQEALKIAEFIKSQGIRIQELTNSINILTSNIQDIKGEIITLSEDIILFETKKKAFQENTTRRSAIQNEIALASSEKVLLESKINQLKQQITDAESGRSPHLTPLLREKEVITEIKKQEDDIDVKLKKLQEEKSYYEFWEKAFDRSGLRSLILDSVKDILDEKANEYSDILTGGNVKIEFNTLKYIPSKKEYKDEFNITATNDTGSEVYRGNSGGEKRKIDICVLLALKYLAQVQSNNAVNILLLDEIFESVDKEGQGRVIKLLKHISKEVESIFVVTHIDSLASNFDNEMLIIKEKEFSYVVNN